MTCFALQAHFTEEQIKYISALSGVLHDENVFNYWMWVGLG